MYKIAVLWLLSATAAHAGPFGLEMGTKLEDLKKRFKLVHDTMYGYSLSSVPQPDAYYETYSAVITPEHGLCKISAISKFIDSSADGTELKAAFSKAKAPMRRQFGPALHTDRLESESTLKQPRDWMRSLAKEERRLASVWSSRFTVLPDHLYGVTLEALAGDEQAGLLMVTYEFENFKACAELLKAAEDASR